MRHYPPEAALDGEDPYRQTDSIRQHPAGGFALNAKPSSAMYKVLVAGLRRGETGISIERAYLLRQITTFPKDHRPTCHPGGIARYH